MTPDAAGPCGGHLLTLPCGHEIGVPSDVPVIGLFGSIREHEERCEALNRADVATTVPSLDRAPGPAPRAMLVPVGYLLDGGFGIGP
jgi:hypothetical protein